ncbi:MAG: hypothetical protein NTW95_02095 [Candidatus Aminicenantes bacterium]|nr:hypothetical protein [Candidatus Aminicenantes bacterium]
MFESRRVRLSDRRFRTLISSPSPCCDHKLFLKDTVVILTDVKLDAKNLADEFARDELVKAGKLHMVEVVINAKKQPISVTIHHHAFKIRPSGGSTEDAFAPELFNTKEVAERVHRESPGESFDDIVFTYDARFHASIQQK